MRSGRSSPSARAARAAYLAWHLLLGAALLALTPPAACAEGSPEQAARTAYDDGSAAYARGDFPAAAVLFATADELLPNQVALESALKAAIRADNPTLAMALAERASSAHGRESLATLVQLVRVRFAGRTGQLTVSCPADVQCSAKVDRAQAAIGARRWYAAGPHLLELTVDGKLERREIVLPAGASVEVKPLSAPIALPPAPSEEPAPAAPAIAQRPRQPVAPAPRPTAPVSTASGVAPVWFWVAAGVTALAAGLTSASGVDALNKHDVYLADPTDRTEADGRAAQTRTNVLLGTTGAAGVTAAILGLFAVSWSGREAGQAGIVQGSSGAHVDARIRF